MPSQEIRARIQVRDDDGHWRESDVLFPILLVMLNSAAQELYAQMSPAQRVNWSVEYSDPELIFGEAQETAEQTVTVHWGVD